MMTMLAGQIRNLFFGFIALIVVLLAVCYPQATVSIITTACAGVFHLALEAAGAIAAAVSTKG